MRHEEDEEEEGGGRKGFGFEWADLGRSARRRPYHLCVGTPQASHSSFPLP